MSARSRQRENSDANPYESPTTASAGQSATSGRKPSGCLVGFSLFFGSMFAFTVSQDIFVATHHAGAWMVLVVTLDLAGIGMLVASVRMAISGTLRRLF